MNHALCIPLNHAGLFTPLICQQFEAWVRWVNQTQHPKQAESVLARFKRR